MASGKFVATIIAALLIGAAVAGAGTYFLAIPNQSSTSVRTSTFTTTNTVTVTGGVGSTTSSGPVTIVLGSTGGPPATFEKNYVAPLLAPLGITVQYSTFTGLAQAISQIQAAKAAGQPIPYDVIEGPYANMLTAIKSGLVLPIDYSVIPNAQNLIPTAWSDQPELGPGFAITSGAVLVYNVAMAKQFGVNVSSLNDMFNPAFKGHVALQDPVDNNWQYMFMFQQMGGGKITDQSQSAAFNILKSKLLPQQPIIYTGSSAGEALFQQGQAWIGLLWSNRALDLVNVTKGAYQFVEPKEGGFAILNTIAIVNGTKNYAAAEAYINARDSAFAQLHAAESIYFIPVNSQALSQTPPQYELPVSYTNSLQPFPYEFFNDNINNWNTQFMQIVG